MSEVLVALCTAPDAPVAERLGRLAVEGGHAACANLIPGGRSIFRWQGALQDEPEVLLVFDYEDGGGRRHAALVRSPAANLKHRPRENPCFVRWRWSAAS